MPRIGGQHYHHLKHGPTQTQCHRRIAVVAHCRTARNCKLVVLLSSQTTMTKMCLRVFFFPSAIHLLIPFSAVAAHRCPPRLQIQARGGFVACLLLLSTTTGKSSLIF